MNMRSMSSLWRGKVRNLRKFAGGRAGAEGCEGRPCKPPTDKENQCKDKKNETSIDNSYSDALTNQ
jgi:hypothetical protein